MTRPFETDYSGAWRGHCKTRESAILAAMRHVVNNGYSHCTITDLTRGEIVARVSLSQDRRRATVEVVHPLKKGVGL